MPIVLVTGKQSPYLKPGFDEAKGEVDEHSRANWRNTIAAASDRILLTPSQRITGVSP